MNKSVVIYGPQGCGKTLHAAAIAKHFGVNSIVDDATSFSKLKAIDHLYIMQERPSWAEDHDRRVLSFADAAKQAGIEVPA